MGSLSRRLLDFPPALSSSYFPFSKDKERKCSAKSSSINSEDGTSLVLRLGQSSHSYISMSPKKINEQNSVNLDLNLSTSAPNEGTVRQNDLFSSSHSCISISPTKLNEQSSVNLDLNPKSATPEEGTVRQNNYFSYITKPKLDLELSLSTSYAESDISPISQEISSFQNAACSHFNITPFNHSYNHTHTAYMDTPHLRLKLTPITVNASPSTLPSSSKVTNTQLKGKNGAKTCQFEGCTKGARGATNFCISHGGGPRCQREGCQRGAEGKTIFCKSHGGGRRCQQLGCTKSAEGRTDFCISHGGGRRCGQEGCVRASRGKSGLCIRHGGGKRCTVEDCRKSAEGISGKCIGHGGGRRCHYPDCKKGAQGSTMLCKAHGGGKRCIFSGCKRGAEGSTQLCKGHGGGKRCTHEGGCDKSVHGGTLFCVRHGGGKRCGVAGCMKSARGRTSFCVRHGGGKRCKHEGCGNSAQGNTDFCTTHGGGKRCSWRDECGVSCERVVRVKSGLCSTHNSLVQNNAGSESIRLNENSSLVEFSLPEGRVHGGNLIKMLREKSGFDLNSSDQVGSGSSDRGKSQILPRGWE